MLIGHVDAFDGGKLYGWAFNPDDVKEHLLVRVHSGNEVLAEGLAKLPRPDLPDAGIGSGDHAFAFPLPAKIKSIDGLIVTAHSSRHGDIVLPALTQDNRQMNSILQIHSSRYNAALKMMKAEIDGIADQLDSIMASSTVETPDPPADLQHRVAGLERRLESMEVFLVRIDETLRGLVEAQGRPRRFGLWRLSKPGNG